MTNDAILDSILEELSVARAGFTQTTTGAPEWLQYLRNEALVSFASVFKVEKSRATRLIAQTEKLAEVPELALAELVAWQKLIAQTGRTEEVAKKLQEAKYD